MAGEQVRVPGSLLTATAQAATDMGEALPVSLTRLLLTTTEDLRPSFLSTAGDAFRTTVDVDLHDVMVGIIRELNTMAAALGVAPCLYATTDEAAAGVVRQALDSSPDITEHLARNPQSSWVVDVIRGV
jgi:hypothetical protein